MKRLLFFLLFISTLAISCKNKQKYLSEDNIIPKPSEVIVHHGELNVEDEIYIIINENCEGASKVKNYTMEFLSRSYKVDDVPEKQQYGTNIFLSIAGEGNPESYKLTISELGIEIVSPGYAGLFMGFQTLRQLFPPEIEGGKKLENVKLPFIEITDEPRFKYRGMHLDVCRHFFSVEDVKSYIDMLAMHKFNVLHWHLTDDQGWRIEIKAFPELAEISSMRKETLVKQNWGEYDGIPYGGYYTQDEIHEIVKYAEDRFIMVIPEIEMPGHSLAALAAFPELGCTGGPYEVGTTWGVFDDVFCAGNDKTFELLEQVIDEVCMLFPNSPFIHIGGDECPKTRWENCPKCQKRMQEEGLSDEHELQSYFIQRMEKYINSKGKRIIGWDEILEGGLAPNATVMSWRGTSGGIAAAKIEHDAILTPGDYCYFDHYQSLDKETEPLAIGGFTNCEKVFGWNPVPDSLTKEQASHIIGVQANVWTEYIADFAHIQYMVLPRMAALSEVAWTTERDTSYSAFKKRLQVMFIRYENAGYNFAKHEKEEVN
ncbi:MAG TPA: beta-N-acetylhexosaminidase [Bacteroidales bacterium]|nr:beta-N-acetylhexosaminidase [Bacteroidales bacterium]